MTVAEYAEQIGIPEKYLRDYCAISDFQASNQQYALSVPYFNKAGDVIRVRLRFGTREQKEMRWQKKDEGKPMIPYGLLWFNQYHDEAYLCEGETDTLCLLYKGHNILGIPGVSTFKQQWIIDYLMEIKTLYLAFDNDEAGRACTDIVIEALRLACFRGAVKVFKLESVAA